MGRSGPNSAERYTPHVDRQSSEPFRCIVFCDVDGVLNTRLSRARPSTVDSERGVHPVFNPSHLPSPDMIERLASILRSADAALVLSSTWRLHAQHRSKLAALMREHGITILGDTPDLSPTHGDRVDECLQWLTRNAPNAAYVCIDDLDLLAVNVNMQPSHFVRTDDECGLTPELAEQALIKLAIQTAQSPPCSKSKTAVNRMKSIPRFFASGRSILSSMITAADSGGMNPPAAWALWRYLPSATSFNLKLKAR
jgi:hypothetical protein